MVLLLRPSGAASVKFSLYLRAKIFVKFGKRRLEIGQRFELRFNHALRTADVYRQPQIHRRTENII